MPTRPPSPCRHPGCPALVSDGTGYCALHAVDRGYARTQYDQTTRRNDPALAQAARIRNSARWAKVRAMHKQLFPLCCDPFGLHKGRIEPNEQSHHILSLATHPELAFNLGNLAPLCTACHAAVEARERAGQDTSSLLVVIDEDAHAN